MAEEWSSSEDEVVNEDPATSLIGVMCEKWNDVQNFLLKYYPDKAATSRSCNQLNDQAVAYFRGLLRTRERNKAWSLV